MATHYDEDDIPVYVDERDDEDGRLDSWENHQAMVDKCSTVPDEV